MSEAVEDPTLCWLDLETTGLNAYKDGILEVVAGKAKLSDPFNVEIVTRGVVWFHPDLVKSLDPYVQEMHTKNGLFKECATDEKALDLFEIENSLLEQFPVKENEKIILAGSSIHFDHDFIKIWMKKFEKRLLHRHYDVSALKLECQSLGMPKFAKGEAHRAEADIFESIAHAKACREWLQGKKHELTGKTAFLNDVHCLPKQTGACKILGPSAKGPEWVIVEWEFDRNHHKAGDVDAVQLTWLSIR